MSISPSIKISLGDLVYESQVMQLESQLTLLPGVNRVKVLLPAKVKFEAVPGDDCTVELGFTDEPELVFTGQIRRTQRGFLHTEVLCTDAGAALHRFRPAATFEKQAAKDIIDALASEVGVDVDKIDLGLQLAAYAAHQRRTAAEHIAHLAKLAGAIAYVTPEGALRAINWPEGKPDLALRYGRDIEDYRVSDIEAPAYQPFHIGNGPAGSASAPDALRQSLTALPDNATSAGLDAVWQAQAILRTPEAAATAAESAARALAVMTKQVRAHCILSPAIKVGSIVEVQELPDELAGGPWLISRVEHAVQPGRQSSTMIEGLTADSGLLSQLTDALSSVGGFL